jgi:6-pyruvoyltetrahydropterin/6-carboxytetrahydropterin synthase
MHELSQRFMFEAAHTLQRAFEVEGSRRVHGHTYFAEVTVAGVPDRASGMVMDLAQLRAHIEDIRSALDHQMLDDVPQLGAPTLENLCSYIADRLRCAAPNLASVRVWREGSGDACRLAISQAS